MGEREVREQRLADLVACRLPLSDTISRVHELPFDSSEELGRVTEQDVCAVLPRFIVGEFSASDVEAWPEALEVRDDVAYASHDVRELLFRLSTPEINGEITSRFAAERLQRYESSV